MKPTTFTAAVLAALLAAPLAAAEPGEAAAETPQQAAVESVEAVEAVRHAPSAQEATRVYRKAIAADRGNVALYEAYMGRMLGLGELERAYEAANMLRFLDHGNTTAWSVVAYRHASEGRWHDALRAAAPALARRPDDPLLLELAGQLVAWYETAPAAEPLPGVIAQSLLDRRGWLSGQEAYVKAYRAVRDARIEKWKQTFAPTGKNVYDVLRAGRAMPAGLSDGGRWRPLASAAEARTKEQPAIALTRAKLPRIETARYLAAVSFRLPDPETPVRARPPARTAATYARGGSRNRATNSARRRRDRSQAPDWGGYYSPPLNPETNAYRSRQPLRGRVMPIRRKRITVMGIGHRL